MTIQRKEIESLIPHSGSMCLNDEVLQWDKQSLLCVSRSHLQMDNPLIKNKQLSVVHAIEYCAQAMAIHGALLARQQKKHFPAGYLAALRNVELSYDYLNDINRDLNIFVKQLMAQGGNLIYVFRMYFTENDMELDIATGRATVVQIVENK